MAAVGSDDRRRADSVDLGRLGAHDAPAPHHVERELGVPRVRSQAVRRRRREPQLCAARAGRHGRVVAQLPPRVPLLGAPRCPARPGRLLGRVDQGVRTGRLGDEGAVADNRSDHVGPSPSSVTDSGAVAHCRRSLLRAVIRRSGPHVIEASVIPAVLFYGCLVGVGLHAAYLGVLAWSYGVFAVRVARGRPVPPLLVLTMIGISVRTVVAIIAGSPFVYFVQPVLSTVAMSLVFLGSVVIGRPLIASLASEFWPLTSEDVS